MSIRLNKVLSELNIGLPTAIEFLKRKGWNDIDNDAGPKTKISEEQYMALKKEFGSEEQPFVETKNNMFTKVYGNKIDKSCDNKETINMNSTNSMEINFDESVAEWRQLRKTGRTKEARDYYCEHLFEQVIERFIYKERANMEIETDDTVLISLLGYSPEPIILAERLLTPKCHVILHDKSLRNNMDNARFLNDPKFRYEYRSIIEIPEETFGCIYETLKEQIAINPARNYIINITGGKKSMVASAGIFGRDFGCNIIYIDYDDNSYDPDIRVPLPGHERMNVVYSPLRDLPELFHLPR